MSSDRGHVTRVTIPLRNRDMDTFGHLNQSMYHVFLEEARAAVIQEVLRTDAVGFVLARVELDHRHEVRMADREVHAEAWIGRIGRSSVELRTRIVFGAEDRLAAEGTTVMVGWDHERRGARRITDEERAFFEAAKATEA